MQIHHLHDWNLTPAEAIALQIELARRIDTSRPLKKYRLIAGADISYNRFSDVMYASVLVLRARDLAVVETQDAVRETRFPYVPGLLSFREAPALLEAFARVEAAPDVVMIDGHGTAHPRRLGIASHLGLWLQTPTVGCAKSLLCGRFVEPGQKAGSMSPLTIGQEVIGYAVRTKDHVKPVFVSPGHLIDLESAVRLVLETCRGYRLPEPTRLAHLHVNEVRRKAKG